MSERFLIVYKWLVGTVLFLVALGGSVRAMNAGLACPDWPLCFGDIIPDYHPQVYFEFIHRVVAGTVSIAVVWLHIKIFRSNVSKRIKALAAFTWVLLIIQVIMGGLTVLWQLHEKVVALHLALGTGFFATLLVIYLWLKQESKGVNVEAAVPGEQKFRAVSALLTLLVYAQIILGGLVASHYAALVCTDFPLCHGKFIPTLKGIIGLHVIHRLGAYTLFLIGVAFVIYVHKATQSSFWRNNALYFMGGLILQIVIGIANVVLLTPPLITVLHLAVGTALLGLAVRMTVTAHAPSNVRIRLERGLGELKGVEA